jgi:hypothetical protein
MLAAKPGDSVWAFTLKRDGAYVLAADLIIRGITHNQPNYHYGKYRAWADMEKSRYFDVDASKKSVESLIRSLGLKVRAALLAQSFQGNNAVRELSEKDGAKLSDFAAKLPVLSTAVFYPEDELEARALYGIDIPESEFAGVLPARTRFLYETLVKPRSRELVLKLQKLYQGKCQICGCDPRKQYGCDICHAHHIVWLCRGGDDELENMCLLCPNHHAAVHKDNATFDYSGLKFKFKNGLTEPLTLNHHLKPA